jgi:predicted naringenin-chalcone synthase
MSSPTILFILERIFNKIIKGEQIDNQKIFACAFGPGLSIEMIKLESADTSLESSYKSIQQNYALEA